MDARRRTEQAEKEIQASRMQTIGWLDWDKEKGWSCRSLGTLGGEWQLCVMGGQDDATQWNVIGRIVNGRVQIDDQSSHLLEGRIVFGRRLL
jgi:hypothetical protein